MENHGLDFRAMPPLTATQPLWGPGCSGSAKGRLMGLATLNGSTLTKGTRLVIEWFSRVPSQASNSDNLTSKLQKGYICYMYHYH